ncbi:MAG: ABC transporter permease [Anaerolineales bacterium]|jgi:ABC-2 type transport system permease protein
MKAYKIGWRENARIILAITSKDILEALKNKNTIAVILTSLFVVIFYRMMPTLLEGSGPPNLRIYDAGNSALVAYLENNSTFDVYTYPSKESMTRRLANSDEPDLGLVIPANFDQLLETGNEAALQGYVMYWVNKDDAATLQHTLEAELKQILGKPVTIQTGGNLVYHSPESDGFGVQAGFSLIFIILMFGLSLIAHLMLEEKQTHTIDALLVSPASAGQVVIAKALTGIFYCLLGAGVALAMNRDLVIHWWLAALTIIIGSLFTSSLGLWLGNKIENRGQLTLWAWVLLVPLLIPVFLILLADLLPAGLIQIFQFIPTVVMFNLFRTSFADPIPLGTALLQLAWVAAWAIGFLSIVTWQVRRLDLGNEPGSEGRLSKFTLVIQNSLKTLASSIFRQQRVSQPAHVPLDNQEAVEPTSLAAPATTQSMTPSTAGRRIIWAIAAKDIREAFHNKLIISIILGVAVMVASNALIPLLLLRENKPTAVVYDQGRSTIIRGLTAQNEFNLYLVDSEQAMQSAVSEAPSTRLGLIIPADFDQKAGSQETIMLDGYAAHWADPGKVKQWTGFFADQLGLASWSSVQINLGDQQLIPAGAPDHILYPTADAGGQPLMISLLLTIVISTIGLALVPLLLVEEREAHTLDVLLASPASLPQVISGKGLAGAIYCLVAALVVILFSQYLFVNWGIAMMAILLGTAFAVAVGLLVGMLADNPASIGIWGTFILLVLVGLSVLHLISKTNWPAFLLELLSRLPPPAMINLFRYAMAINIPAGEVWANAAALAAAAGSVFALTAWLTRRAQR